MSLSPVHECPHCRSFFFGTLGDQKPFSLYDELWIDASLSHCRRCFHRIDWSADSKVAQKALKTNHFASSLNPINPPSAFHSNPPSIPIRMASFLNENTPLMSTIFMINEIRKDSIEHFDFIFKDLLLNAELLFELMTFIVTFKSVNFLKKMLEEEMIGPEEKRLMAILLKGMETPSDPDAELFRILGLEPCSN